MTSGECKLEKTKMENEELAIGQRVEAGEPGTDDHDTGTILAIAGDTAEVGWDSEVQTSIPLAMLVALEKR